METNIDDIFKFARVITTGTKLYFAYESRREFDTI